MNYLEFHRGCYTTHADQSVGIVVVKDCCTRQNCFFVGNFERWGSLSQVGFVSCLEEGAV